MIRPTFFAVTLSLALVGGCGTSVGPSAAPLPTATSTTTSTVSAKPKPKPTPTTEAAGAEPAWSAVVPPQIWLTGTLITVPANDPGDVCIAINTRHGAYALASSDAAYDTVTEQGSGVGNSGIHLHGQPTGEMLYTVGDRVRLRGSIEPSQTDFSCSRYYTFGISKIAR